MSRYVYGKNSVKAALEVHPEKVFKIFFAEGLKPDKRLQAIHEIARERKIVTQIVPRFRLDQLLRPDPGAPQPEDYEENNGGPVHQGVVASVAPKALLELNPFIKRCREKIEAGEQPRVLVLDGVTDPRNFGAILRVADAVAIEGVIIPRHNSAGFGPALSKTASGAEETVPIVLASNVTQALRALKEAGFWIAGAAYEEKATLYHQQDYRMPVALAMGSEGKGLAPLVRKNCDFLLSIPMWGAVDSLNVATATAVLLFEMNRHLPARPPRLAGLPL
jgi:23S rRNA (guanosine2251-2'-O)-methyltransferase